MSTELETFALCSVIYGKPTASSYRAPPGIEHEHQHQQILQEVYTHHAGSTSAMACLPNREVVHSGSLPLVQPSSSYLDYIDHDHLLVHNLGTAQADINMQKFIGPQRTLIEASYVEGIIGAQITPKISRSAISVAGKVLDLLWANE